MISFWLIAVVLWVGSTLALLLRLVFSFVDQCLQGKKKNVDLVGGKRETEGRVYCRVCELGYG